MHALLFLSNYLQTQVQGTLELKENLEYTCGSNVITIDNDEIALVEWYEAPYNHELLVKGNKKTLYRFNGFSATVCCVES